MRCLAIGDIHGCRIALEALVEVVGFEEDDTIITLGDVVDRGPDAPGVIEILLGIQRQYTLIHLRGNHEVMMLEARNGNRGQRFMWHSCGGSAVLEAYGVERAEDIPQAHWDFIESSRRYLETETHLFVHAGVDPGKPLAAQNDDSLFWEFFENPDPHQSGKTMICGHSAQKSGLPKDLGYAICIDTWAYGGQWLTCLDVTTGIYWQANEQGETRTKALEWALK